MADRFPTDITYIATPGTVSRSDDGRPFEVDAYAIVPTFRQGDAMDPRLSVERARREALERKLRLIQVALGRTPGGGPAGWARRFERQPRGADPARTARRKT